MLRLISYFTPSHADMFTRYVLPEAGKFDDCRVLRFDQTCPTGSFKSAGWNDCMLDKLRALLTLPTDGVPTIYVDADVALLPGFKEWAEDYAAELGPGDVAFSDDVIQWCAGVMAFHSTQRVREWWQTIFYLAQAWNIPDQDVIHSLRAQAEQRGGVLPIRPMVMPPSVVCNWATVNAPTVPSPWDGEPFAVPPTCMAWHANFTVGVVRKSAMLEHVVSHGWRHDTH